VFFFAEDASRRTEEPYAAGIGRMVEEARGNGEMGRGGKGQKKNFSKREGKGVR